MYVVTAITTTDISPKITTRLLILVFASFNFSSDTTKEPSSYLSCSIMSTIF